MKSYLLFVIISSYISYTLCVCNQTVIVVGAGAAGLAAAQYLTQQNCTVTVLEAQARTGGRCQTITLGNTKIDVGASWIHGIGPGNGSPEWDDLYNPIYQIAQDNKIETVATWENENDAKSFIFEYDGTTHNDEIEKVSNDVSDYQDEHASDAKDHQSLDELLEGFVATQPTTAIWQLRYQFALSYNWGQNYAANTSYISAKYLGSDSQFTGREDVFPDGYEQIIAVLSKGVNITMSAPVTKIDYTEDIIQVTLANKSIITADKVIVTVPLAILQSTSITFTPALAATKQTAINNMGAGLMDKLVLQFTEPFWDTSLDWLNYVSDQPGQWVQTLNLYKYLNKPYLMMFNIADSAQLFGEMTDAQVLASAMIVLRNMYPGATNQIAYYRTNWGVDQFEKMAYTFIGKHATEDSCEAIAEGETTDNKVFFAGEHTNCYMIGTVHGAYVSGQTAAKRVMGENASNQINNDTSTYSTFKIISIVILLFTAVIY